MHTEPVGGRWPMGPIMLDGALAVRTLMLARAFVLAGGTNTVANTDLTR